MMVYVIQESENYTKIKMQERIRAGQSGEPIAELTKQGWIMICLGQESGLTNIYLCIYFRIYSGKRNTLHLVQISLEVWVD